MALFVVSSPFFPSAILDNLAIWQCGNVLLANRRITSKSVTERRQAWASSLLLQSRRDKDFNFQDGLEASIIVELADLRQEIKNK